VALGGVTFLAHQSVSSAKSQTAKVTQQVTDVSTQLAALQPVLDREAQIQQLESNMQSLLTTDVAWKTMITQSRRIFQPGSRSPRSVGS